MSLQVENCRHRVEAFHVGNPLGERNTWRVVALTACMMAVEIVTGYWFNSMALLADGWHMSTHVAALGITGLAYLFARRYATDPRFAFGTWKIEVLGGFAGAIVLGMVAVFMAFESAARLLAPLPIRYDEALAVTVIGLLVNVASAGMLAARSHVHDHDHGAPRLTGHDHADRRHSHPGHEHDLNLRAAYAHVMADAFTSVLAVVALVGGKYFGWFRLDPVMGLVGAVVVGVWAFGLVQETGRVLLDREMDHPIVQEIRSLLEADGQARVTDLHVWRVGYRQFAGIVALTADQPKTPDEYRDMLSVHAELVHLTIEVAPTAIVADSRS